MTHIHSQRKFHSLFQSRALRHLKYQLHHSICHHHYSQHLQQQQILQVLILLPKLSRMLKLCLRFGVYGSMAFQDFIRICKLDSVYGVKRWRGSSGLSKFYQRRQKVIKRMKAFLRSGNYNDSNREEGIRILEERLACTVNNAH